MSVKQKQSLTRRIQYFPQAFITYELSITQVLFRPFQPKEHMRCIVLVVVFKIFFCFVHKKESTRYVMLESVKAN